jgi:hypothetical protein
MMVDGGGVAKPFWKDVRGRWVGFLGLELEVEEVFIHLEGSGVNFDIIAIERGGASEVYVLWVVLQLDCYRLEVTT